MPTSPLTVLDQVSAPSPRHDPLDVLERAIRDALEGIEAARPGSLVSLSVPLPDDGASASTGVAPGGDCRWLTPGEDSAFYGAGAAFRLALRASGDFDPHRRGWVVLGGDGTVPPPVAFWTLPPALDTTAPVLWVPRVLMRRQAGRTSLTVSLRRGTAPVAEMARVWLAEARGLLAGRSHGEVPAIAARTPGCDQAEWADRVRRTTEAIAAGRLTKAVLARRLSIRLTRAADPTVLADRLADLHPSCSTFCLPHGNGHVVAASPERLAVKRGSRVVSSALAGTACRHARTEDDDRAATDLRASPKERREHAIVADAIAEALAEVCDSVDRPETPGLMRLRQVQHLWTPVTGHLRPGVGFLDIVSRLHPTPAVLGWPRRAALDWLRTMNEGRDGLYTGVAGWVDRDGDGEAAVILRSTSVEGRTASLWAGAGIMAESDPAREWAETELKLSTMLSLFGDP
ncbi:isochorismate synthase MenF [uncultured Rhodospira sp.]|uniref:isochorismate synthase n=1 Tax=uncultured Rhodospira sp. TaxID=1936189 RepID=UPI0026387849|nr:isochorismate synthase [uncultured Rhodospira sp.]